MARVEICILASTQGCIPNRESDFKAVAVTVNQRPEMRSDSTLELGGKAFCQAVTFSEVYREEIHRQVVIMH